jgi:SAM-dependent methyltransferase
MNWHAKAAAFRILSALPGGAALYRSIQERITKSLVPTRERVSQKIDVGLKYFNWLADHELRERLIAGVHLDFGAGWHPTIPLLYYGRGVNRQHLLDVTANLDGQMLGQTIKVFLGIVTDPRWPHRAKLGRLPAQLEDSNWREHLGRLGVSYHAPYADAFAALVGGVDVVTSTQVLLYVPRSVMPVCFSQVHASLKPGGVFLATAYLRDVLVGSPYSSADKYNHLSYSPESWERWFNSSIMSFNRFKAPDYREMLERAGFEVVHFQVEPATAEDYAELDRIQIHPCFQRYTREDLAARELFFVARKR